MYLLKIALLAIVQGITELLPVSSSAHVIMAEKLLGLNPVAPEMTMLLVMLHTGTMFAVIVYFWDTWKRTFFGSRHILKKFIVNVAVASFFTGLIGFALQVFIEKVLLHHVPHAEVEMIFGNTTLISLALAAVGTLIVLSDIKSKQTFENKKLEIKESIWIGIIQGLCLPFRGFSRSGATISTGLLLKIDKMTIEAFSFALAVVLTPPVIIREALRLSKVTSNANVMNAVMPDILGLILSFIAGLFALHWLTRWLSRGRWNVFGFYCIVVSIILFILSRFGF